MDNIPISPIFWVITTIITTTSSVVLGIITWIKSAKLMPKELTKAELENKKAEVSLADQYEIMATRAAEKAVGMQERLTKNEEDISTLKEELSIQKEITKQQDEIIKTQTIRLDKQETKIQMQIKQIKGLSQELKLSQAYNAALINQIQKENLIPIDISAINVEDYRNGVNGDSDTNKTKK